MSEHLKNTLLNYKLPKIKAHINTITMRLGKILMHRALKNLYAPYPLLHFYSKKSTKEEKYTYCNPTKINLSIRHSS